MKKRLLLLDDDARLASGLKRYFELKGGWEFSAVEDPRSALKALEELGADILVLDLNLGDGDRQGLEFLKALRRRPKYRELPVLILTGARRKESEVAQGFELGADQYLLKPISPRALEARAQALLRLAQRGAWTQP